MRRRPKNPAAPVQGEAPPRLRVCVVGSGPRFLSGISYYTNRLAGAMAQRHDVSVILMRQLLPTRLYPGRKRVGKQLVELRHPPGTQVFDGVDWFWGASIVRAVALLVRRRPDVVVLQWWTGTVLHTYLALALVARLLGARVVMEYHEVLDTGELAVPLAAAYVRAFKPLLVHLTDGAVVHSEFDRRDLVEHYAIGGKPLVLAPHGPYDQHVAERDADVQAPAAGAQDGVCRLLYFGVIRPFKGVEDLVEAFGLLSAEEAARFHLTVVGETWEAWEVPAQAIAASPHRGHITFVNRYVADDEVGTFFAQSDVVVLPYHRSSASGPLHIAMAHGLPVIVSQVGGLVEATQDYAGAVRIPPADPAALAAALPRAAALKGRRFDDPHSWERTLDRYDELFPAVLGGKVVRR